MHFCRETKYNLNDDLFIVGRDWLGAMTPIWNEDDCSIVSEGFSTRFHLEGITSDTLNIPLYDDFNTIDLTLPVLALKVLIMKMHFIINSLECQRNQKE